MAMFGMPRLPPVELRFTIEPPPPRLMAAICAFIAKNIPSTLASKARVYVASSNASIDPCASSAALFTATSRRPKRSSARSTSARVSASMATSVRWNSAGMSPSSFSSAVPASSPRLPRTKRAPRFANSSAVARPMPLEAPVTRTTLLILCSFARGARWSSAHELRRVDGGKDLRRARPDLEVRVRVRPAHDACAVDKEERGDRDLVMGLARVALDVQTKALHLRERSVVDVVDHVERLDHLRVAVAQHWEGDRVGSLRLGLGVGRVDADRDGCDSALLVLGVRRRQRVVLGAAVGT